MQEQLKCSNFWCWFDEGSYCLFAQFRTLQSPKSSFFYVWQTLGFTGTRIDEKTAAASFCVKTYNFVPWEEAIDLKYLK